MKTTIKETALSALAILLAFMVVLGIFGAVIRDCARAMNRQGATHAAARDAFTKQCLADGKTQTDCVVLWSQVDR